MDAPRRGVALLIVVERAASVYKGTDDMPWSAAVREELRCVVRRLRVLGRCDVCRSRAVGAGDGKERRFTRRLALQRQDPPPNFFCVTKEQRVAVLVPIRGKVEDCPGCMDAGGNCLPATSAPPRVHSARVLCAADFCVSR